MANGYVKGGLGIVVENTTQEKGFNILLMGDGFTEKQQQSFENACQVFRQTLFKAPPFNKVAAKINIYKLNVVSTDSGAGDGAHPNKPLPRNYFGSWFDPGSNRLLICVQKLALDTAVDYLPNYKAAIVVVNTSQYGGSGGQAAVYSMGPFAERIALHEMGHSVFLLADEYGSPQDSFERVTGQPVSEPSEPNVTSYTDPAKLKWRGAVKTAEVPMLANKDCSQENKWDTLAPGTVGLFEGARYHFCQMYRPQFNCIMRSPEQDFCVVCQQVILNYFDQHVA